MFGCFGKLWTIIGSYFLLEGKRPFFHLLEADDRSIEALLFLPSESHLHQSLLLYFPRHLHPLHLHLLLISIACHILPLVLVVIPSELKYPVGVDLADIVDVVGRALDDLVVDYPLRVHNAGY